MYADDIHATCDSLHDVPKQLISLNRCIDEISKWLSNNLSTTPSTIYVVLYMLSITLSIVKGEWGMLNIEVGRTISIISAINKDHKCILIHITYPISNYWQHVSCFPHLLVKANTCLYNQELL